jgi:hypothetical protein
MPVDALHFADDVFTDGGGDFDMVSTDNQVHGALLVSESA